MHIPAQLNSGTDSKAILASRLMCWQHTLILANRPILCVQCLKKQSVQYVHVIFSELEMCECDFRPLMGSFLDFSHKVVIGHADV